MINPQVKLFDDLIEIAKYDVKFIDLLRPYFLEKYSIDVHDLLFHDFNNMDTNIHSNDPIVHDSSSPNFYPLSPSTTAEEVVHDSPSPDFYPSSPSTIIDDDTPIPDNEWYFSDNS